MRQPVVLKQERRRGETLLVLLLAGIMGLAWMLPWSRAARAAEPEYPPRNDKEFYTPYLFGQGFGYMAPQQNQVWRADHISRALMVTYGEARVTRRFFVDFTLESLYTRHMPSEPVPVGVLQENLVEQPDAGFRVQAYYLHHPRKDWEISVDTAMRFHLFKTEIPAEFHGRVTATHLGFSGTIPVFVGLFVGPDVRPVDRPVGGMTLGAFTMVSPGRRSLSTASLALTWWGEADPFQNLVKLRLGQAVDLFQRTLTVQVDGGVDLRQVRTERYEEAFQTSPEHARYVDLILEGTALTRLPGKVRLGITGRFVPVHTPDELLVRWYRPVYPQAGLSLARKFGVLDLEAGYALALVPPFPIPGEDYVDSGTGIIPDSSPGHLWYVTIALRI